MMGSYSSPIITIQSLIGMLSSIFIMIIHIILFFLKNRVNKDDSALIKRTVLDLGTKYSRLKIKQISKVCKEDNFLVIQVVKEMIENQEIYADYFSENKTVAFYQQANVDEIDILMAKYEEWESTKVGKKVLKHV